MTPQEKVIDKIKAALRKADESQNDSEAERDTAMRMAQRLLLKHGLTMKDVGDIGSSADGEGRKFDNDEALVTDKVDHWCGTLLHAIADVYFCKVYYYTLHNSQRSWYIVGRNDHVDATVAMFDFVEPQLQYAFDRDATRMSTYQRDARRYALASAGVPHEIWDLPLEDADEARLAEIGRDRFEYLREDLGGDAAVESIQNVLGCSANYAKHVRAYIRKADIAPSVVKNLGVWRRSWFDAAVSRVKTRLMELRREEAENLSGGTDLVVNERTALDRELDRLNLGLRKHSRSRKHDMSGARSGDSAGRDADLSGHSKLSTQRGALNSGS